MKLPTLLVTGGAGFIGSNLVLGLRSKVRAKVVNLDKLTYAGNLENLTSLSEDPDHIFVQGDIRDRALVLRLLQEHNVSAILNLAAESHVDRSIDSPGDFISTNIVGTFELLEAARAYVASLAPKEAEAFRFVHVSTDEVFGSLGEEGFFTEESRYSPNSPYAASKAGADHLARAYFKTYGLPVIVTNCSNNYGPYQFPEKLIPLMILNALEGKPLPVYGDGGNIRDWLYVGDHCEALWLALTRGLPGESYLIGGQSERTNLVVVETICSLLDDLASARTRTDFTISSYRQLIQFVKDRPGHDRRYAVDPSKSIKELGFAPTHRFEDGLRETILWYLSNRAWCDRITTGVYRRERLGLGG